MVENRRNTFINKVKSIIIIHIYAAPGFILLVKIVSRKIPLLFTVHGFHGPRKIWDYRFCARICYLFTSQIITVAQAETKSS